MTPLRMWVGMPASEFATWLLVAFAFGVIVAGIGTLAYLTRRKDTPQ